MGDFTITDELQRAFDAQKIDCIQLREATPELYTTERSNPRRVLFSVARCKNAK